MTDREKLIFILSQNIYPREGAAPSEVVADYLIDHDVVPIVRCKNCKYSTEMSGGDNVLHCSNSQWMLGNWGVYKNDFCVYGERKEYG